MRRVTTKPGSWQAPGVDITDIHDNPGGDIVGTIAMPTRDRIAAATAMSWLMTDLSFLAPGESVVRHINVGHVLAQQRNECVQQMQGDWILFIDDDMVWPSGAVKTLVETRDRYDLDMVGGLCFQRGAPHQPTLYVRDGPNGNYNFLEEWAADTAVEVDASGMAFMLIHRRVFDRILGAPMPSFVERRQMPPPPFFRWEGTFGEDFLFCQEAQAAGCHIFVDTEVQIGHLAEITVTADTFYRELAFRSDESFHVKQLQNERMGLPVVTAKDAYARVRRT